MKLDNFGFGMKEMIIYSCVLLLVLIFVSIEINAFYADLEKNVTKNNNGNVSETKPIDKEKDPIEESVDYDYYERLEDRLYNAAESYLRDNRFDLSEDIHTITANTLVNMGYMSKLVDQNGNSTCFGYVNAYGKDDELVIKPSIVCYNYETER